MAFDILGIVTFNQPLRKTIVNEIEDNKRIDYIQTYLVGLNYQIVFLSRNKKREDFFENKENLMIVIGEPFLNLKGTEIESNKGGPLTAQSLLKLYNSFDTRFTDYIKGNFSIVVINKRKDEISIFNSKFGVSPLYYSFRDNTFLFSTRLSALLKIKKDEFDDVGMVEYALFGYPLGTRTFFKNCKGLLPATRLTVRINSCEYQRYWNCIDLFDNSLYSEREAQERGVELFKKIVNLYAQEPQKICLSLTGGFDCRAILSVLEKKREDLLCYSFGIPGSFNISIPYKICNENKINYLPIYLNDNYERVYNDYAMEAIFFSDCLSTFERANYPYAFERLSSFSPVVITGIFGSELMRTFQNISVGYMVNKNFVHLNFAQDKKKTLATIIRNSKKNSYYCSWLFNNEDELSGHIYEECFKKYEGLTDSQRFFLFLLNEGVRKYFGGEVHMERRYATNRFPFLDDDFVDFIFKSPFCGIYTNPLRPTIKQRFKSQLFYSFVIKRYYPELLNYPTDHGYSPKFLLSKMPLLCLGPSFLFNRVWRKIKRYREFKTEEWSKDFYHKHLKKSSFDGLIFSKDLKDECTSGHRRERTIEFARAVSLKLYLENIFKD